MAKTNISWADVVWNPVIGCNKVSDGCRNCYAELMAYRLAAMGKEGYDRVVNSDMKWTGDVYTFANRLEYPFTLKKPKFFFVDSMGDTFHEKVTFSYLDNLFRYMAAASRHVFIILTKRADRMAEYFDHYQNDNFSLPANIWPGVSIEDQITADKRIPYLLQTNAPVKVVSAEPLLGPVDLRKYLYPPALPVDKEYIGIDGIQWVICGGEQTTFNTPRRMDPAWAVSLHTQCAGANVPFWFKQWGNALPDSFGETFADIEATKQRPENPGR